MPDPAEGSDDDLVTSEGVNERGTEREASGPEPDAPPGSGSAQDTGASSAPGLAVGDDFDALDGAPEPNEPA